jgi:hypothetical protein
MKAYKRTETQSKILAGMGKVYERLVDAKRKTNSEIVILKNNKIVHVKP